MDLVTQGIIFGILIGIGTAVGLHATIFGFQMGLKLLRKPKYHKSDRILGNILITMCGFLNVLAVLFIPLGFYVSYIYSKIDSYAYRKPQSIVQIIVFIIAFFLLWLFKRYIIYLKEQEEKQVK